MCDSELDVLELTEFFGDHIYGALDDYKKFSKAMIIQRMISDMQIPGNQLLGFGDGFVEIEEVKKVGGVAIGVASNEVERRGINAWKRERLIRPVPISLSGTTAIAIRCWGFGDWVMGSCEQRKDVKGLALVRI